MGSVDISTLDAEMHRRRKAEEVKAALAKATPKAMVPNVDAAFDGYDTGDGFAGFAKIRASMGSFEKDFDGRTAGMKTIHCPRHPRVTMALDRERSMSESWDGRPKGQANAPWQIAIRYKPCPACVAAVGDVATHHRLKEWGVPGKLVGETIDSWIPRSVEDRDALVKIRQYAARPRGFLFLLSKNPGPGKTHLAVGILRMKPKGLFVTEAKFMEMIHVEYSGGPRRAMKRYQRIPFLVFDELGFCGNAADVKTKIHELMDERINERRATIITGNVPSIEAVESIVGPRLFDRMTETAFTAITLAGKSMREEKRDSYLDAPADGE